MAINVEPVMINGKQQDAHSFPPLNYTNNDIALHAAEGDWTYAALYRRINQFASGLLADKKDLQEERIAFFLPASVDYVTTLLGVWRAGGIAVPLHHIYGIINVLCCGLWIGARITLFPKFDMETILHQVQQRKYTVLMAVPTIYVKIIQHLEAMGVGKREAICAGFRGMRLNISGSAACSVKLYNQWKTLTGQTLLERYGMTEIGMGISNPYIGDRRGGAVGIPLPGVEVALFDEQGNSIKAEDAPGEIRVKGDNVFLEYWNNAKATAEIFVDDWFCTGDVAVREKGYYRIMGRSSVDIIKSGGYKLSALEIEGTLLACEKIAECAVIGLEDETWGEAVAAFVVLKSGHSLSQPELKAWCESRMSPYKIPKTLRVMENLPRNAMGKVLKPALKKI